MRTLLLSVLVLFACGCAVSLPPSTTAEQPAPEEKKPVDAKPEPKSPALPPATIRLEPKSKPDAKPIYLDAAKEKFVLEGRFRVAVVSSAVDKVKLKTIRGVTTSQEDMLILVVGIRNISDTKKLDYKTWRSDTFKPSTATLKDEHGNFYKSIHFGFGDTVINGVDRDSIYPDSVLGDILVFEKPIPKATQLFLELDGQNLGEEKLTIRFTFKPGHDFVDPSRKADPDPVTTPMPEVAKPQTKPAEKPAEKKFESILDEPKPKPVRVVYQVVPAKNQVAYLGTSALALTEAPKQPELRAMWLKKGDLIEIKSTIEVGLVKDDQDYPTVEFEGKEYRVKKSILVKPMK